MKRRARGEPSPSLFVSIEGGDGTGKTTQAHLLYGRLKEAGLNVKLVQEPGTTPLAEYLRLWLKGSKGADHPLNERSELFLFAAARADLVDSVLIPFLSKPGSIVVADRYVDSTRAYQGYGRGLDRDLVDAVNRLTVGNVLPDLTILLDCPPEKALERLYEKTQLSFALDSDASAHATRRATEGFRLEEESLDFHNRVYEGYREMARTDPHRWHTVDASRPTKEVSNSIWKAVSQRLAELNVNTQCAEHRQDKNDNDGS